MSYVKAVQIRRYLWPFNLSTTDAIRHACRFRFEITTKLLEDLAQTTFLTWLQARLVSSWFRSIIAVDFARVLVLRDNTNNVSWSRLQYCAYENKKHYWMVLWHSQVTFQVPEQIWWYTTVQCGEGTAFTRLWYRPYLCSDVCVNTYEYCTGNPGWDNSWCADQTCMYVRQSCPVMCGLCVADAGAVADRCPPVQASKKSPSINSVSASRPSPTGGGKEDGEGEHSYSYGEVSGGYQLQHPRLSVMLLHALTLVIIKLYWAVGTASSVCLHFYNLVTFYTNPV